LKQLKQYQIPKRRKRRRSYRKRYSKAHVAQAGSLVLDQQQYMLKANGSLPSMVEAQKAAKLTALDRRIGESHIKLIMLAYNQCKAREGEEPFQAENINMTSSQTSISSSKQFNKPDWARQIIEAFLINMLKRECGIIDPRLNPDRVLILSWDKLFGFFYWPKTCPKFMFPCEIVERKFIKSKFFRRDTEFNLNLA
jgi:hypothetical protein